MRPLRWLAWLLAATLLLPPGWRGESLAPHKRQHAATDNAGTGAVACRPNDAC
jgi:hypothetical protein